MIQPGLALSIESVSNNLAAYSIEVVNGGAGEDMGGHSTIQRKARAGLQILSAEPTKVDSITKQSECGDPVVGAPLPLGGNEPIRDDQMLEQSEGLRAQLQQESLQKVDAGKTDFLRV